MVLKQGQNFKVSFVAKFICCLKDYGHEQLLGKIFFGNVTECVKGDHFFIHNVHVSYVLILTKNKQLHYYTA